MNVLTLTSENFEEEVINSNVPVLVDFWASWCMPCKMMSPVIDEIANEEKENLKVGKINIDEQTDLAVKYGVMSIPTFIVFKNGKPANMSVGVQDKNKILELLK